MNLLRTSISNNKYTMTILDSLNLIQQVSVNVHKSERPANPQPERLLNDKRVEFFSNPCAICNFHASLLSVTAYQDIPLRLHQSR